MARYVRVSTIAYQAVEQGDNFMERQRDKICADLELAAQAKPDLVALPEFCNVLGLGSDQWTEAAEPIPGPTSDRVAEVAAKHGMNVVLPIPERDGDRFYNTAAFINREGEVVGKYHKYQPTVGEMEKGIVPGVDAEAFDLDIGKVGAAICFDLKYVEVGQRLAANGARLVVFASMFIGGERILHWARDFGFYVLSSCPARSYLADMSGRFLGETGSEINQVRSGLLPPIFSTVINMDRMMYHLDYNQGKFQDILKKYGPGVEIEVHYPEAHFTMASLMDDVTIEDINEEFELEPWIDYLARCRRERGRYLKEAGVE
ncbi:MAG: carbon-nitrogen hydrolase family protein [Armatimonadetes bacterium]|nr:carbon-nitrogen hydrolase family protein [Armatimonadota bacterium]